MDDLILLNQQIRKEVESLRPNIAIRHELDIGFSFENGVLIIYEIRPFWQDRSEIINSPFAKAKFVKTRDIWKLYWMRANLKWYPYDPDHEVGSLSKVFQIIRADKYHCFFG